jgi:signal transduction histidine kinase
MGEPHDHEQRQKARFAAVRRRVFEQMRRDSSRWRVGWFVPFNVLVVGLVWFGGGGLLRCGVQIGSLLLVLAGGFACERRPSWGVVPVGLALQHYLVGVANTGGVGSPMISMALPILAIMAIALEDGRWRGAYFAITVSAFGVMGIFAKSVLFAPPSLLAWSSGGPSTAYVVIATVVLAFASTSLLRIGSAVTRAYAEIALELAARREEICEDSEDHSRALEGVAARLAHEVKNPLAAIKALSTHVARSSEDARVVERLNIVAAEADRLKEILDGFLSFSRGLDDLKLGEVRPYDVARELAVLLETRAAEANLGLDVVGDADVVVHADGRKLRQALLNLVLNAMQASPSGSTVRIAVERQHDGVRIRVVDRGVGMSMEILERIQKPYFSTRAGGSGLGVAVARALIRQHGGDMRFDSQSGMGTTVTVDLPRTAPSGDEARLPRPAAGPPN